MIQYIISDKKDIKNISLLLSENDLPYSDIIESQVDFLVAKSNQQFVGCIGIEKYGTEGLLRSFAVNTDYRRKGYGKELYDKLIGYSIQNGIKTMHLLTATAKEYFLRKGFKVENKDNAPETIRNCKEFKNLCPSSSVYMVLEDISTR